MIVTNVLVTTGSDGLVFGLDMKWEKLFWSVPVQPDKMLTDFLYVNGVIYLGIGGPHESEGPVIPDLIMSSPT